MRNMFFTDDNGDKYPEWKEKKLREVLNLHYGKDQKGYVDPKGKYPILGTGGEIGRTNTPLFHGPSVLIGRKGTIDKPRFMETPFRTVDTLFYTSMKVDVNAKFIYQFAKTVKWRNLSEATGVPSLNSDIILNVPITLPSLPEQEKIATFFSALDDRIELHASKVALLKEQKKGYLQKVFSRELVFTDDNGDSYPEWEEKKLGDVANLYQPQTISGKDLKRTGYPVYGANGQIGFYDRYNHDSEQVAVTCRGNTCGTLNYTKPFSWITGNAMVVNPIKGRAVKKFLYYCLESTNLGSIISGSGQPQITRDPLAGVKISVPSLPEQEKIAGFFSALDENIELNENKLALLKEQKKGYLQGIFG